MSSVLRYRTVTLDTFSCYITSNKFNIRIKYMSVQEQARKILVAKRNAAKLREDSMLSRIAKEVGLSIDDLNDHNWKLHNND